MTTIQTNDATEAVVIYPRFAPPPTPGHTVRQVDAIPPRPPTGGTLKWDTASGSLIWYVPPPTPRDIAASAFATLPAGKRALWEPVRTAVDAALKSGDLTHAAEIIRTVPEIYDGMEADRTAFLALFAH